MCAQEPDLPLSQSGDEAGAGQLQDGGRAPGRTQLTVSHLERVSLVIINPVSHQPASRWGSPAKWMMAPSPFKTDTPGRPLLGGARALRLSGQVSYSWGRGALYGTSLT